MAKETCSKCGWSVESADEVDAKTRADAHAETHKAEKKSKKADVPPYDEWTVEELKQELFNRGLPVSGLKDDLVKALKKADK